MYKRKFNLVIFKDKFTTFMVHCKILGLSYHVLCPGIYIYIYVCPGLCWHKIPRNRWINILVIITLKI